MFYLTKLKMFGMVPIVLAVCGLAPKIWKNGESINMQCA